VLDNLTIEIYRPKAAIYVPKDVPTIQQAVDSAKEGDRMVVADGEYCGPGNRISASRARPSRWSVPMAPSSA